MLRYLKANLFSHSLGRAERNYSVEVFLEACTNYEPKRCVLSNTSVIVRPRQITAKDIKEISDQKLEEAFNSDSVNEILGKVIYFNCL